MSDGDSERGVAPPPALLQRLIDRQAIDDVLYRYARGIDRLDAELFRTVFWEDGGFEDGVVSGPSKEFVPGLLSGVLGMFALTQHYISNVRVEFDTAELAFTECYFTAFHLLAPGEGNLNAVIGAERIRSLGGDYSRRYEFTVGGRYLDRFEKRGSAWRIQTRRFVVDWTTSGLESGIGHAGFAQLWTLRGSRNSSDPSYRRRNSAHDQIA